ncbi:uncharacterized protein [Clytia hemisphaerica]|uniref:Uncharacterized protein n=1 Tax=Clytia hemisphaerica TaxID=252671 RepID=A0A7M5WIK4_9CNID|eukprot:TCONS_00068225-protein
MFVLDLEDQEQEINATHCRFLDLDYINDSSFVSIDLNDDKNECEICHQTTEEPIVNVVLSDEFLKYEKSIERCGSGGAFTKAHQICLDRWSEVIERNLKIEDSKSSPPKDDSSFVQRIKTTTNRQNMSHDIIATHNTTNKTLTEIPAEINQSCSCPSFESRNNDYQKFQCKNKRDNSSSVELMKLEEIKKLLEKLENFVTGTSNELVEQLQLRDKLSHEISGQKAVIAQLVQLQKPHQRTINIAKHLKIPNSISKTSISV